MSDVKYLEFLKDVFICSLGAYGGPEAHIGIFIDQLAVKKKYLTEEEIIELTALCSILPGPTSTQTIVSVGYKKGGAFLAFLTMLVWALPVLILMTMLSFLYMFLSEFHISGNILRFIGPMAVGFIITAAFRINRKVIKDKISATLMLFSMITTILFHSPWIFPLLLVLGGVVTIILSKEKNIWQKTKISPPWKYLSAFIIIAVTSFIFAEFSDIKIISLFEKFYRYGYLVFGGGQVVVPLMHSELVEIDNFMTNQEFLTGYGLVQGLPGPMFSFAAYAGGMSARNSSIFYQILGAIAGGAGIFLPGLLLIYFVYPVWEKLKKIKAVKISLKGINAVAGGLIAAAGIILFQKNGFAVDITAATLISAILLLTGKIPAPIIVVAAISGGILF